MSRGRRAILGFGTDIAGQVLLTLAALSMAPIILHHITAELYGFWLTALSIVAFLGLVDVGLGIALTRAIASISDRSDAIRLNQLISTAFVVFCLAGFVFSAVGLTLAAWIPEWFSIPQQNAHDVIKAFRIVIVASACALPCSIFSGINCGFQQMAADNISRTAVALLAVLVSWLLLYCGWGLMALAASTLFSVLATAGMAALWALRCHPEFQLRLGHFNRKDFTALLSFGGYFQLGRVANTVALNSDSVVISSVLGAQEVAPYVFTSKLATLFSVTLASKMPIAAMPALSQMYAIRDFVLLQAAFIRMTSYAVRLAICGGTVYALGNKDFVTLWVGASQYGGLALSAVFCYWVLQDTIFRGTASALFASGELRAWSWICLGEAALNLSISLLLVREYGLLGVALGTAIGKTLTTAWLLPILICRSMQLRLGSYLIEGYIKPAFRCLLGILLVSAGYIYWGGEPSWWRLSFLGGAVFGLNVILFEGIQFIRNPAAAFAAFRAFRQAR
jgi:O-antigen/teichoic acid export membrane protein